MQKFKLTDALMNRLSQIVEQLQTTLAPEMLMANAAPRGKPQCACQGSCKGCCRGKCKGFLM